MMFRAVLSMHLAPNKEPNWCYCRCWSGSKAPSRRVHTGPALPCAGAGVQVTGYLEARLGEGSVSVPLAFPQQRHSLPCVPVAPDYGTISVT